MPILNTLSAFRRCLFTEYNSVSTQIQILKRNVFRPRPVEPVHSERNIEIDSSLLEGHSPNICQFLTKRYHENKDSKIHVPVRSFVDGELLGSIQLNEFVFGTNPRLDILQRVVVWQRAKARAGTACVKDRSEVRGGGRKPWPQKGLGKARQGSIRAPHWRGGGVVHGPKPKSYAYTLPKKVRRMGMRVALSCRLSQGDLFVVDSLDSNISGTELENLFEKNNWNSVVLVNRPEPKMSKNIYQDMSTFLQHISYSEFNAALSNAVRCQKKAEMHHSLSLNVYSILNHHKIVLSLDAIANLEEKLCEDNRLIWR